MNTQHPISVDLYRWRFKAVEIALGSTTSKVSLGRMYSLQISVCGVGFVIGAFHAVDSIAVATP